MQVLSLGCEIRSEEDHTCVALLIVLLFNLYNSKQNYNGISVIANEEQSHE